MAIRLAHVNVARDYRGGERQTELLVRELAKRDLQQILVLRRGSVLAGRFGDLDVELREVSGQMFGVTAATRGVDLVQVHEGRSVYGAYLRHVLSGTPYVATRRVDNRIKNHWFSHQAYSRAACVVAVAPQVADVVRAFDAAARVQVIHSASSSLPVNAERAAAIRSAYPGRFIVGHVGALDNSQKAQEHIIAVARSVEQTHPDLQFVLVGGGSDEAMLKQQAAGLTNVAFTGFVDNVGDYLASFDLFVLPSRREGIGSILLDAMEAGLAVVATRVGGVPAIVRDGENGRLIDAERPDQLRDAILALRDAPELRKAMGRRGREIASQYTAPVMASRYAALYERILGAPIG